MSLAASVLGIWGAALGGPGEIPERLPAWAFEDPPVERRVEENPPLNLDRVWLPFDLPTGGETPVPGLLPPVDEPETPSAVLGRAMLEDIRNQPRFFPGLMNVVLFPATLTVETLAWLLLPRTISLNGQTLFDQDGGSEDIGTIFVRTFVEKEIKFLAGLGNTPVSTMNVELGLEEYDHQRFDRLQSRVIFDSLKKAYRERYHVPALDLDTLTSVLTTGEWLDYFIVPAVVSAYAARYGIDRKIRIFDDLKVQIHIEKAERLYKFATERHGGEIGAIAVNVFKLPVSVIFQADRGAHSFVDPVFVGIGTDLNVVLTAIDGARFGR